MNRVFACAAAFLAALVVHLPATEGRFLDYDDARFVVRNESIESLDDPLRFFTDLETTASADSPTTNIYRPVRTLSFAVLTRWFGKSPRAFHATSVVVHALTTAAVCALLLAAGLAAWPALAGSLVFALHPVTVESTAWVCSLGDLFCGLFGVLAVLAHARDRRVLAHLALVVALFSKEHAVVVPGLWLAWDLCFRKERFPGAWARVAAPGAAVVLAFLVFRGSLGADMAQTADPLGGSHGAAVKTMLSGLGFYAASLLFPSGPTFDVRLPVPAVPSPAVLFGLALLAGLLWAAWRARARPRLAALWVLMALVPVSNVLVPLKIPTADRFLYLPLVGVAFAAGELCRRRPLGARFAAPAALAVLSLLTVHRIGDWRDDGALVAAGLRANPKSKTWLWKQAAEAGRRTMDAVAVRDLPAADRSYHESMRLYEILFRNTDGVATLQAKMEVAELKLAWGRELERHEQEADAVLVYGEALQLFFDVHREQRAGRGRVILEEVRRAAQAGADLAARLARLENPHLHKTVKIGTTLLQFLRDEFGQDVDVELARLIFIYSVSIRGKEPARARQGYVKALEVFREVKEKNGVPLTFPHAQALFYLSVIDRDPERMRYAAALYRQASGERRDVRLRGLLYEARAWCTLGRLFGDKEALERGRAVLESVPATATREKLPFRGRLRREYESMRATCASE